MGRRLRLQVPGTKPEHGPVVRVPGDVVRAALQLADGDRKRLEITTPPYGVLAEIVVHNRPIR